MRLFRQSNLKHNLHRHHPPDGEPENTRKEAENTLKTPVFRPIIPAEIPVAPAAAPMPPVIPANSAYAAEKIPVLESQPAIPVGKNAAQETLSPAISRKFIAWEDLAAIFQNGRRSLTRPATVAALKKRGFGKSAAYEAVAINGRFAPWLQFTSDGIITLKG